MLKFIPFILSLVFYTQVQGQGEFPLINRYASWSIYTSTGPDASEIDQGSSTSSRFKKDTTIKNTTYAEFSPSPTLHESPRKEYIREIGNKVYVLRNGEETLLYDYDLEVGNSLHIQDYFSKKEFNIQVTSIDSVEINGHYRKRLNLDAGWMRWWIQGIGSNIGLVYDNKIDQFEVNINMVTYKTPDLYFYSESNLSNANEKYCQGTKWYYSGIDDKVEIYEVVRDTFIDFRQTHIIDHKTIENSNTTTNPNIYLWNDFSITYLWEDNTFIPMFNSSIWYNKDYSFVRKGTKFTVKLKDQYYNLIYELLARECTVTFTDKQGKEHIEEIEFYSAFGITNSFLIDENLQPYNLFDKHYGVRCYEDCSISLKTRAWESSTSPCDIYLANDNILDKQKSILIYPNPVPSTFSIQTEFTNSTQIKIYDITGKEMSFSIQGNQIDISGYPHGIYFLEIQDDSQFMNLKIIKE